MTILLVATLCKSGRAERMLKKEKLYTLIEKCTTF